MRRELGSNSVSKQERLRFESLAILLEAQHDNADARMRHCREAAGILRQLIGRIEAAERQAARPRFVSQVI
ncbi:hypothetical protein CLV79_10737 [Limimaricola soesokkakensis]|uniref:Uncharacterized protein n=1 Tax=Limimaricola soesokkakensis TaxID=1343159 RepID=A0A1X6ZPB5_9RHOB|nr:hypothetical protein [Limimaricola soesokkakensis]PSK85807.1 hypothetical protein CLV79_10737 [Limimaricola soesokkakensis]SLN56886.1 hypothetical protein LOS8367_02703 [Limimaricola soesokkakensis]